jgi:arylsulfatase A-like enzyme
MFRYALFSLFILTTSQLFAQEKTNVLMIVLDDLNDYVGVLDGHPQAKTPNIDRLAKEGVLFTNAHANVPVCQPSRASFMTGVSPLRSRMWGFSNWLKNDLLAQATTLPEFLKNKGYVTMQSGKVFHSPKKGAWSLMGVKKDYGPIAFNGKKSVPHPLTPEGMRELGALDATFFSLADVPEVPPTDDTPGAKGWYNGSWGGKPFRYVNDADRDLMTDEKSTVWTKKQLEKLEKENASKPFFMAIGLHRPHTPLVVPQTYFDLFPLESIQIPVIKEDDIEDTFLEKNNLKNDGGSRGRKAFDGLIKGFTTKELALKKYTQAYLASVAFADDRVGELLEALENSKFANNTIVILFSDHGYHLGEKKYLWKYNLWEETTRVPLIIKAPKYKGNSGKKINHPVSLLDIYPTILSLTGNNVSSLMLNEKPQLDGFSLEPFLQNPKTKSWDGPDAALTVIASWRSPLPERQHLSVRGKRYRYIKYANGNEELYDHKKDPYEWYNLASSNEHNNVKQKLFSILNQQLKIVK